jgi:hypothetical protein
MPTTRRRIARIRRASGLTEDQRQHLECGHAYFASGDVFADDAERRTAWRRHRRSLLAAWDTADRPGQRPQAVWDYDFPSAANEHGSEAAAVHVLLADAVERRLIEVTWLRVIEVAILQATKPECVIDVAAGQGVPAWFARQHAPDPIAASARDLQAARVGEVLPLAMD